jgi:leader peptidase (prepilin peptidase)/N-methyltransferase
MLYYYYAFVFLFGLIVGSFLNVVIHRLPRGGSVVSPRSACPRCGRTIRWYENIPVASYLALKGKCAGCGGKISASYPVIEFMGGVLAVGVSFNFGLNLDALFIYSFLMALLAVTVIDWRHRIIPDQISLSFIVVGLVWSVLTSRIGLTSSLLGVLVGGGGLFIIGRFYRLIRHVDGMGGGDIKLMAMIGAFVGVKLLLPVLLLASFFGSIYGIYLIKSGGGGKTYVSFGSFLAPAAAFCIFYGRQLLSWYFGQF